MLPVLILISLAAIVSSQDPNCDYTQNVEVGKTYYVYSPSYPSNYPAGSQCRWIAKCPTGYNCVLQCSEVNIPESSSCSQDRLLVSKSGDPQLNGADVYCGKGTFTAVSTGTSLSVGLISATSSAGGRFYCSLTAKIAVPVETCSCGYKKTTRIVGGQETGVNEFPMMAGVIFHDVYAIKCGAVIIDKRVVMTAAHCLANQNVDNIAVIVGEHNITTDDSPATQGIRASYFRIHPQFNPNTYDYDIALIILEKDITFSNLVGPVCLPFNYATADFTGKTVTFLGWGTQFPGGPTSNVLQKVDVGVISNAECSSVAKDITSRQICTYRLGKDACQDDSGGPALWQDNLGRLYSVGIISHGQFCATRGQPGVNTNVGAMLPWIVSNTPNANYCVK